jgi:hypothetical protein
MQGARARALRALVSILLLVPVTACTAGLGAGEPHSDGGAIADGRAPWSAGDECGNGIDDDQDGRIDDGCPCGRGETQPCFAGARAARAVGACTDGTQTCAASGEWGDWGDAACVGGRAPGEEACDGSDHDCDGAIDEGCPCTAGERQECGVEFLLGECRPGAQSCRADGTWSGCEGAIGPRAEVCGDDRDDDCDGAADELCGCAPEPEICGDGIDNDCDGVTDESPCGRSAPGDAGMCAPETCDGTDEDCDGVTDDGCEAACGCSLGEERGFGEPISYDWRNPHPHWGRAGWNDRDGELGVLTLSGPSSSSGPRLVHFQRRSPSGDPIGASVVLRSARVNSIDVVEWLGDRYLVRGGEYDDSGARHVGFAIVVSGDGTSVSELDDDALLTARALPYPVIGTPGVLDVTVVREGTRLHAFWTECYEWTSAGFMFWGADIYDCTDRAVLRQELSADLAPIGEPSRLTPELTRELTGAWEIVSTGTEIVMLASAVAIDRSLPSSPSWIQHMALLVVRGSEVVSRHDDAPFFRGISMIRAAVAFDDERILACYTRTSGGLGLSPPATCRFAARDGRPIGEPFDGSAGETSILPDLDLFRTACGFELSVRRATIGAGATTYTWRTLARIHPVDGSVTETDLTSVEAPVDEAFVHPSPSGLRILRFSVDARTCLGECIRTDHAYVRELVCP